ncbi:O-antigen ligase family protein [Acinetobacter sp. 194]|nr:O-antigen ligase family protein [Acinetobacter shaoyimingii]
MNALWDQLKHYKFIILIGFLFLIFTFHYAFNLPFRNHYISIFFVVTFLLISIKHPVIRPSVYLIVFCISACVFITIPEYLMGRLDDIPKQHTFTYKNIIRQYVWIVPFVLLPTIYQAIQLQIRHFYAVIVITLSFLFLYFIFYAFELHFDRLNFVKFFDPVISYDIGFISLCIVLLCYSFLRTDRASYLYLIVSLLTMFMLILHGSRGTWLGIPIVLIALTYMYRKTRIKKLLMMWAMLLSFILINILIPQSPMFQRIEQLQRDADLIVYQQNYQNSSGIRLFLWKRGIDLFQQSPVVGRSMYAIQEDNCRSQALKQLPRCFQHLHSIYFHELAAHGVLGIFALLFTFFSALIFFAKQCFNSDLNIQNLALTGLLFVVYYMICGLTEYYLFFINTTYLFYWITASLMTLITLQSLKLKKVQK